MLLKIALLVTLGATSLAKDDQKWVWGDNSRDQTSSRLNYDRDPRYEVFEGERPYRPDDLYNQRPQYRPELNPVHRPGGVYGGGGGIIAGGGGVIAGGGSVYGGGAGIVGGGGGVYGGGGQGNYGQGHPHYPSDDGEPEILTGPIPSWVKEGPFKNYDKCKCTEKFNCNSPGISYGHCDVGKQYCCYATKKHDQIGGPLPSRPHHSIENGILAGPGGPVDLPRPGGFRPGRPGGSFGLGGGHRDYGPISNRPIHSPENGILVGPGGPFDRPIGGRPGGGYGGANYGFGRSAKN